MNTTRAICTHPVVRFGTLLVLLLGSCAISVASLAYFDDEEWPIFVMEKLPLSSSAFEELWLNALQIHVVAAAFALPACLVLLSKSVLKRAPTLHRILGRVVGLVVLFALAPTGLVMAFFAKGGALGVAGFLLTGVIVVVAMVNGIVTARRKQVAAHRRSMLHVVAQLSVAVSSRVLILALDAVAVDAERAYLIALWLPVVGSALIVELLVARPTTSGSAHRFWSLHAAHGRRRPLVRTSLAGDAAGR